MGGCQAAAAVAAWKAAEKSKPQRRRPNIVLVLADDLGYSDLSCFGNTVIQTPNLDRLASEGTRFTQFYMTSPVCSPSRAALMTGHYPQRYGIHHADVPEFSHRVGLPESAVTIAEVLQAAGYYTAHIGKWHLGEPPDFVVPRRQGFDYFLGLYGGRPNSGWAKYSRFMNPEIVVNEDRPVVYPGNITEIETKAALDVLDKVDRDRPFFLNLWYNAPHEPLAPVPYQGQLYGHWSAAEQVYFQTVTDLDKGIGQVLARLDQMGIRDDTLVLFTSDNGPAPHRNQYSRGSTWPLKGMKSQLWEGGIRVPAIVRWPGRLPADNSCGAIASVLDLFPTLCAAAGAAIPAGLQLDGGIDVLRAMGSRQDESRALFFEFHYKQRGVATSLPMAVRKGRWKLFSNFDFTAVELYDLQNDIGEKSDVAKRHEPVVRDLKSELQHWYARFSAQINADLRSPRQPGTIPSWEELEKSYYHNHAGK